MHVRCSSKSFEKYKIMQKLLSDPMTPHNNPEWRVITCHGPRKSWQVCCQSVHQVLATHLVFGTSLCHPLNMFLSYWPLLKKSFLAGVMPLWNLLGTVGDMYYLGNTLRMLVFENNSFIEHIFACQFISLCVCMVVYLYQRQLRQGRLSC